MAGFAEFASAATSKAAGANKAVTELTKSFKSLAGGEGDAGAAMGKIGGELGKMTAGANSAGGVLGKVTAGLKALGPEGEAAAAILQVVAAAVTAVAVTLWDWAAAAVASAQKRDALVATFNALGASGEATLAVTSKLAASLPYTTSQVNAWAKSLMAAGVQGQAMEQGVRAIASATAIMGQEGGAAAEMLIKRFAMAAETGAKLKLDRRMMNSLAQAGVSAAALAEALGVPAAKLSTMSVDAAKLGDAMQKALVGKGGAALANVGLTWDSIKAKFDEGIGSIFSGMSDAVRPFMQAIKDLFGEFNKGAPSVTLAGGVMKSVLTKVFDVATRAVNALHYGFLVVEVAALKVAIAVAPFVKWLIAIYSNAAVLTGIKVMLVALLAPLAAIIAFFGLVAAGFAIIVTGIATGIAMIGAGFSWIVGQVANFIGGIVEGISSGTGEVVAAVTKLAADALKAFKSALGIKSPSAVMRVQGQYMAAGTVQGLEAGTPAVRAASARMGLAGAAGAGQGATGARAGSAGGGGVQVTFAPGSIVIDGAGKSAGQITEEMIALVFERLAGTQGLATA